MNDEDQAPGLEGGVGAYLEERRRRQKANGKDEAAPRALTYPKKGDRRYHGNLHNALTLFENEAALQGIVAFDEMQGACILMHPVPRDGQLDPPDDEAFEPRLMTDADDTEIQAWLQWFRLPDVALSTVRAAILARARANTFHPVRDYLEGLTWDGTERLDHWLEDYLDVPHDTYAETIGPMFLISMVARAFQPGAQVDHMLVLEGSQGIQKSSACRALCGSRWFSESLPSIANEKDAMQHLRGKWLVEIAEMDAIRGATASLLKSFLSRIVDRYRPPYGHHTIAQPRTVCFIGSTNETDYLHDQTGNRRFWPIKCGSINVEAITRDRDQLFAEAVMRFKRGDPWWPKPDFEVEHIAPQQEERREIDPWEDDVADYLIGKMTVTLSEVAKQGLELSEKFRFSTPARQRLRRIMERNGWVENRTKQARSWVRPSAGDGAKVT